MCSSARYASLGYTTRISEHFHNMPSSERVSDILKLDFSLILSVRRDGIGRCLVADEFFGLERG